MQGIYEDNGRIYGRFKIPKIRSPKHLKWVATCPCIITGMRDGTIVPHHLLRCDDTKGMGTKSCDSLVIPIKNSLHLALHKNGDELAFLQEWNWSYLELLEWLKQFIKDSPCAKIRASGAVDRAIERQKRIEGMI